MPGAYRYSATFDRTYEEDPPPPHNEQSQKKSQHSSTTRSVSSNGIHRRSASTDSLDSMFGSSGSSTSTSHSRQVSFDNAECIPTRVVKKVTAKPAHNPLQFVKVSSCPLSRKAEELAKKKPEHKEKIKDEEEEWQSNLDNWKSRRRKQSEGALQRLEEIKRIEMEERQRQQEQKKTRTKTFSEMMEERAQRPKQYNLHIYSRRASESVIRLEHDFENGVFAKSDNNDNSSCDRDSSDSTLCDSTVEEVTDNEKQDLTKKSLPESGNECKGVQLARRHSTGGNHEISYNRLEKHLAGINESELEKELAKEKLLSSGGYANTDSGLDSLSSSHKTGDIADSASDFSQDSGSSLDSDFHHTTGSLTTGVELLEEFSSRVQSFSENVMPNYEQKGGNGLELFLRIWLKQGSENKDFGFILKGRNDQNVPVVDSVIPGGVGDQAGLRKNDQILAINGECTQNIKPEALSFVVQQASYTGHLDLVIWRAFNNTDCNANGNSTVDLLKTENSEVIHQKQPSETVEKQNSLVSHKRSSFEDEPNQKNVIQRTNKDIRPALDFKEKVSSFERRSSVGECSSLVSKQVSSKARPPVPAKPPQLQSNSDFNSPSPSLQSVSNKLPSCGKKANTVDTNEKGADSAAVPNSSKCRTDTDQVSSKLATKNLEEKSKKVLYIDNSQQSVKDTSNENSGKKTTENSIDDKKIEVPVQNIENEERHQPQRLITLQPVSNENGLNIIYDSHPEQITEETEKSKPKLVSQECIDEIDTAKIDDKKSNVNKNETKSLTRDESNGERKERHKDDKLKELDNQTQKVDVKKNYDLNSGIYDLPLNLSQDEILLADLDISSRKIEPPKEKPPPPPPDESDIESSEKPPVMRANSTKEIKRELWKRRSDFLGIEFENGPIEVDESQLPCPPAIEDILKSERELEREKRKLLEQQTALRLRRLAEEEEIARKEKEIIENIEREERERQQQALEMEAALMKERELSIKEIDQSVSRRDIEANNTHQQNNRKKSSENQKSSLQQLNSVNRIKNELPVQEKERYIRHQQGEANGNVSKEQPVQSKNTDSKIKQSNTNSETLASQNNSSAVKSDEKEINTSSSNKAPSKKMIIRQERERLRREQENLQKDSRAMQKHQQKVTQASKQCKPNSVQKDIVPNRVVHDQSRQSQSSSNPWDREDIIYASRHPEAAPADAKSENGIENENNNQELLLQSMPLSKHNLHSLGAAPKAKVLNNEQWIKPNEKVSKRRTEATPESGYNQYHWLVQEAEIRRIAEQKERQYQHAAEHRPVSLPPPASATHPNNSSSNSMQRTQFHVAPKHPPTHCALPCGYPYAYDLSRRNSAPGKNNGQSFDKNGSPTKPPRSSSSSRGQLLSVSGRKRCSHCGNELGRGAAMIIESLQLFYHIQCFCCCVCQAQLGNGSCGTDVRVRNNKLHCQHCYSNDEAGLKFSQV